MEDDEMKDGSDVLWVVFLIVAMVGSLLIANHLWTERIREEALEAARKVRLEEGNK